MKRICSMLAICGMLAALSACGRNATMEATVAQPMAEPPVATATEPSASTATEPPVSIAAETAAEQEAKEAEPTPPAAPSGHADTLVVYFSATGTTEGVAQRIASVTGGDLYEIQAAQPYTEADLNYNSNGSRANREQKDKTARPEIGSDVISLEGYKTVFLGFPIWWGEEPRILDTFVETYSLDGVTVIPFCTSGSSGIGKSGANMETLAGSGTWLAGKRFNGNVSEAELQAWIAGLQ